MGRQQHPISPATFREPVLRALGTLTNLRANVPVPRKAVVAEVQSATGYHTGQFGVNGSGKDYVEWAIGRAYFLIKRDERLAPDKMKRGMWALSERGVEVASTILTGQPTAAAPATADPTTVDPTPATVEPAAPTAPAPAPAATPTAAPAPAPASEPIPVAATSQESDEATEPDPAPAPAPAPQHDGGVGVSFSLAAGGADSYHPDPYIRSLAIQATSCFGAFSSRSSTCGSCPLAVACKGQVLGSISVLAGTLRKRDADAKAKAAAEAKRAAEAAKVQEQREAGMLPGTRAVEGVVHDEAIDDILAELESDSTPDATAPATAPATVDTPTDPNAQIIEAVVPTICAKCNTTIETGTKCQYVAGQGVFHHPACP
jgi:outer membrane biosynthesis protein TonB